MRHLKQRVSRLEREARPEPAPNLLRHLFPPWLATLSDQGLELVHRIAGERGDDVASWPEACRDQAERVLIGSILARAEHPARLKSLQNLAADLRL